MTRSRWRCRPWAGYLAGITAVSIVMGGASAAPVAQERCRVLCAPELKIEPTFTVENLFGGPVIETIEDDVVVERAREPRETVFELIFALDVPTAEQALKSQTKNIGLKA